MDEELRWPDILLVTVITLAVTSMAGIWGVSAMLAVAAAAGLVLWMSTRTGWDPVLADDGVSSILLLLPVLVAAVAISLSPGNMFVLIQNALPAAALAIVGVATMRCRGRVRIAALSLGLVAVVIGSSLWVAETTNGSEIDIVFAHEEAADALVRGENPYEVLRIRNTSPYGDGEPFVGYPYPPVSLLAYGGVSIVIPLPAVAAFYVAVFVVVLALSGYSIGRFNASFALATVVVGAPALGFMLFSAATEGFTSLMFLLSGVVWRRRPVASAALMGIAIASKQYLIIPAFALLLADVDRRWTRIGVGVGTAALVSMPFFLWGQGALIDVMRVRGSGWDFRPDAMSVGAFGVSIATVIVSVIALFAMWSVRKKVSGPGSFFFVAATGLAVMLALHPHSLVNHWFGLLALIVTGIVTFWHSADNPVMSAAKEANA